MSVSQKYLRDENGNVFSPIVSMDSVMDGDVPLKDMVPKFKVLFTGSVAIPSQNSGSKTTINVLDDVNNYDILIVRREGDTGGLGYASMDGNGFSSGCNCVTYSLSSFGNEKWNVFGISITRKTSTTIEIGDNLYMGIHKDGSSFVDQTYSGFRLMKIIGIKL